MTKPYSCFDQYCFNETEKHGVYELCKECSDKGRVICDNCHEVIFKKDAKLHGYDGEMLWVCADCFKNRPR